MITGISVSVGLTVALMLLAKLCPKEKLAGWILPITRKVFTFIDRFLMLRLGANWAHRIEQGVLCTLLHVIVVNAQEAENIVCAEAESDFMNRIP